MDVLVLDVGGTTVKMLATDADGPRQFESGANMTPEAMVDEVQRATADWHYDVISLGYPGTVDGDRIRAEPGNLGEGWVGFDFEKTFGKPVRIVNDAVMQALGGYDGGRMLYPRARHGSRHRHSSPSTSSIPLELGCLPYSRRRPSPIASGVNGLETHGVEEWRRSLARSHRDAARIVLGRLRRARRRQRRARRGAAGGDAARRQRRRVLGRVQAVGGNGGAARSQAAAGVAGGAMRYTVLATDLRRHDRARRPGRRRDRRRRCGGRGRRASGWSWSPAASCRISSTPSPTPTLFDLIVGENGAVLYDPVTKTVETLTAGAAAGDDRDPRRSTSVPLSVGHSIVATVEPYEHTCWRRSAISASSGTSSSTRAR